MARVVLAFLLVGYKCVLTSADDAEYIRAIGDAYLANRESFNTFSASLVVKSGVAASIEEARRHGPQRNVVRATAVWVKRDGVVRYELQRDINKGPRPTVLDNGRGMYVATPPQTVLFGKEYALHVSGVLGGGSVGAAANVKHRPRYTTWNFAGTTGIDGKVNPGDLIADFYGSGERGFSMHRSNEVGRESLRLEVTFPNDDSSARMVFFLDEERGCIPVERHYKYANAHGMLKTFVTDIRECSTDQWFPMRVVNVQPTPTGFQVTEVAVTKLSLARPSDREMEVTLPAGTTLSDPSRAGAQFNFEQSRQFSYGDLVGLIGEAHDIARWREATGLIQTPATEPSAWRTRLIIGNVLLIATIALGYGVYRYRRAVG